MNNFRSFFGADWRKSLLAAFTLLAIAALGGGYGFANGSDLNSYHQTNLVSDIPGNAANTNKDLINSWGIARSATSPWWVNDNGTGVASIFNSQGQPFAISSSVSVTIPPPKGGTGPSTPTGIVFNGTKDFEVAQGMPALFIFVTEDGTISGWNPAVDVKNAVLMVDNSQGGSGAVFKGAAMALDNGVLKLFVANFRNGTVDVFDTDFKEVDMGQGAFTDPDVPEGFAPFNVLNVDGRLFVTFAKQDAQKHDDVKGPGNGFVDVFAPDGTLLMSLQHGNWLNSPWGVALAPENFGKFSRHLLVGQFGSGQIAAFDPKTGDFKDLLMGADGKPVTIDGLWGLEFGNGAVAGPKTTLFFTAGPNGEKDGLFGNLTTTTTSP